MIGDITKAVEAYRRLTPLGKRLFREEIGLKGPRDGVKRKRRRVVVEADAPVQVRATRRRVDTVIHVPAETIPT